MTEFIIKNIKLYDKDHRVKFDMSGVKVRVSIGEQWIKTEHKSILNGNEIVHMFNVNDISEIVYY